MTNPPNPENLRFQKMIFFQKSDFGEKTKTHFLDPIFFSESDFLGEYSFDVEKSDLSISDGFRAFRARQVCFPEQSPCVSHSYAARGSMNDQNQ